MLLAAFATLQLFAATTTAFLVQPNVANLRWTPSSLVERSLFGGAPPPPEPSTPGGGKTMTIPGIGSVSEEEMKLAMEFRNKIGERMAAIVVESTALGGKVKVSAQPLKPTLQLAAR